MRSSTSAASGARTTRIRSSSPATSVAWRALATRRTTRWPRSPGSRPKKRWRWQRWRAPRWMRLRRAAPVDVGRITVTPDPFTLIAYDAKEIASVIDDVVALIGLPSNVEIDVEVDEELPSPLTGHTTDVVDGRIKLWISGGNLEDNKRPRSFSSDQARRDFTYMLLRAKDRLSDDFAGAASDGKMTRGERSAWDVYSVGRASRLGFPGRRQAQLYEYRLQHGFTDVADEAFERLWKSDHMTWEGIREICKETGAADRSDCKSPIDL